MTYTEGMDVTGRVVHGSVLGLPLVSVCIGGLEE